MPNRKELIRNMTDEVSRTGKQYNITKTVVGKLSFIPTKVIHSNSVTIVIKTTNKMAKELQTTVLFLLNFISTSTPATNDNIATNPTKMPIMM